VTFKEMESVDAAQKARPHRVDERDVEVKRAMPREVCCTASTQPILTNNNPYMFSMKR